MKHSSIVLSYVFGLIFILILIAEVVAFSSINRASAKDMDDAESGICLELKPIVVNTAP